MAVTVAGAFEDRAAAWLAIESLLAAGVPADDISMIVRDTETGVLLESDAGVRGGAVAPERSDGDRVYVETPEEYTATATGTAAGGLIGAVTGLLVGLGTLALPGLGPIVAAGPLAAALGGAAIGAATGGLIGALVDAGVPEEYTHSYAAQIERGHVLLTVHADEADRGRVRDVLEQAGALNVYPATTTLV